MEAKQLIQEKETAINILKSQLEEFGSVTNELATMKLAISQDGQFKNEAQRTEELKRRANGQFSKNERLKREITITRLTIDLLSEKIELSMCK